jgi:hypothetical protein
VLARLRRRGVLRTAYEIDIRNARLTATLAPAADEPADHPPLDLGHSGAASLPTLRAGVVGDRPRLLVRAGPRGPWIVCPAPASGDVAFVEHQPWPGRGPVTVEAVHSCRSQYDTLVVVIGVCAVLAHRSLTFDLVTDISTLRA